MLEKSRAQDVVSTDALRVITGRPEQPGEERVIRQFRTCFANHTQTPGVVKRETLKISFQHFPQSPDSEVGMPCRDIVQ
jgi:hypothetical protein